MSCKHRSNVWIQIAQITISEIDIVDGQANANDGDPTPTHYDLRCGECGQVMSWHASRVPKWVMRLIAKSSPAYL